MQVSQTILRCVLTKKNRDDVLVAVCISYFDSHKKIRDVINCFVNVNRQSWS